MELTPAEVWSEVLAAARDRMPEQSFRTWLQGSEAVGFSSDELLVEAPSEFHAEWLEDKYGDDLTEILGRVLGKQASLSFQSSPSGSVPSVPQVELASEPAAHAQGSATAGPAVQASSGSHGGQAHLHASALNERYTFDRFVVGNNNQLAAAASRAVSEKPGRTYNPLFLYGGVGLGKTHLMHAVGHSILERDPRRKVAYVTTESFMNDLVRAIQQGTTREFRQRYRKIDLLLIDDVHFLERKDSTQEEFFHTFNALYDAGKQVVLTSDRPPKELPGVEDRLVSRFEWGLVADIKPPDYETRVAILQKKAADDGLSMDEEVMDFIARSCTASVRELEGAVIKLLAYSSLRKEEVTVDLARTALQGVLREQEAGGPGRLSPELIRDRTAAEWDVKSQALTSKRRTRELTVPRQVAMYLIRELTDESLNRIGQAFGGRDHSTVIHSIRKVEETMEEDEAFAHRVRALQARLESP